MQQREIKFRAWILSNPKGYMAIQGEPDLETLKSFIFHYGDKDLMQYTGIKDKNGKEIYEGDICSFKGGKYEIQYGETLMGFFQKMVPKHTGHFLQNQNMNKCEVIGNIYENPELVQK